MEKNLRKALNSSSPEEFLQSLKTLTLKSVKPLLKTLIHSIKPSASIASSLPLSLSHSISLYINRFHTLLRNPNPPAFPSTSPLTKPVRRSARRGTEAPPGVDDEKGKTLERLRVYAYVVWLCVSHPKKVFDVEGLLVGARELHDSLRFLECDLVLLSEVFGFCEEWWKEGLVGREELISQSLPYLLSRSLTLKKKVDVHRVYMLRDGFCLFDFEDSSIVDLKVLLIRCVIEPLYLKNEDGRKFISFMFGLSRQLMKEVLAMIKSQIPFGRKSILEAYGNILFQAWKAADVESRDEIENNFLQDLIEGAFYARSDALAASIRRVLGGFVNQRTTEGVEKLLFRLSEPLIFRSLQVANSNVRHNALHLLLDLFPLEDPDSNKEVKDLLLEKQFFLLEKMLMDDCPDIRVVAVEGSCRILRLFWEVISSSSITKMITKIFDDMSYDICNEVRVSTVNGVIYLFGNPHSHEILKVLLPRLGHLMLDSVLSVRLAVTDLLLLLRDIRGFHFNKVVRLDILLSTLANDQPLVAQKITQLLIPSYFPSKVDSTEACTRCITLIKRSPKAGARFCEFIMSEGASLKSLVELVRALIDCVMSLDKLDADQIEGFLVAAACLCRNLANDQSHKTALKDLLDVKKVKCLYGAASSERAHSSIFTILSTMFPEYAFALLEECMTLVTNCGNIDKNVDRQAMVKSAHRLIMTCDAFHEMFEALTSNLQKVASSGYVKCSNEPPKQGVLPVKRKKTKSSVKVSAKRKNAAGKNPVEFEEDYQTAVGISWQVKELLMSDETQKVILRSPILEQAFLALKVISEISIVQCIHCDYMDAAPVVAYSSVALHVNTNSIGNSGSGTSTSDERKPHRGDVSELWMETAVDVTLDHLLSCADKFFRVLSSENFCGLASQSKLSSRKISRSGEKQKECEANIPSPSDSGLVYSKQRSLINRVIMLADMLTFIVDAITLGLVSNNHQRCLKFTSAYIQHVISSLGKYSSEKLQFEEDVSKEIYFCLKSSFTCAAKLLNLVLKYSSEDSPPQLEAFCLANDLLDLVTVIESSLGSRYARGLSGAAKPWLPDVILALGLGQLLNQSRGELTVSPATDYFKHHLPSWFSILARTELLKISSHPEEDKESGLAAFPIFEKLMGIIASLLRRNPKLLDAVGSILLRGLEVGLERKNFGLALGLLHFVCVKLVGCKRSDWVELDSMLQFLHVIYPQINREFQDQLHEDGRESTWEFIHSIGCLLAETGKD